MCECFFFHSAHRIFVNPLHSMVILYLSTAAAVSDDDVCVAMAAMAVLCTYFVRMSAFCPGYQGSLFIAPSLSRI